MLHWLPYHPNLDVTPGSLAELYLLACDHPVPAPYSLSRGAHALVWKVPVKDRQIAPSPTTAAPPRGSRARTRTAEGPRRDAVLPHRVFARRSTRGPPAGCRSPSPADRK